MTTFVRHPWYDPPTMKRKLFTADASHSSDPSPATLTPTRRKRARYHSLERTLAHMTLGNTLAITSEDADMWPKISPPRPRELGTLHVILPSSVEEPGTVNSEPGDVDMEVEPTTTVPVDTIEIGTPALASPPGLSDWQKQLNIKEVQISSAVLDRLRKQSKYPPPPIPLPSQTSQALVLYRALRPPSLLCNEQEKSTWTSILVAHEDDVMEVE